MFLVRVPFETLLRLAEARDAQLRISLVKGEDVIASYEEKEVRGGGSSPGGSLVAARSAETPATALSICLTANTPQMGEPLHISGAPLGRPAVVITSDARRFDEWAR